MTGRSTDTDEKGRDCALRKRPTTGEWNRRRQKKRSFPTKRPTPKSFSDRGITEREDPRRDGAIRENKRVPRWDPTPKSTGRDQNHPDRGGVSCSSSTRNRHTVGPGQEENHVPSIGSRVLRDEFTGSEKVPTHLEKGRQGRHHSSDSGVPIDSPPRIIAGNVSQTRTPDFTNKSRTTTWTLPFSSTPRLVDGSKYENGYNLRLHPDPR